MESKQLQDFFFWCMVVNSGIYTFTAIAVLAFRRTIVKMQQKMFGLEEDTILTAAHRYLAMYKLFITAFNFTPWVALLIISK